MSRGAVDAVVLAGGFGTRLRTVIADVPKPLAPVAGRPFLDYLLIQLNEFRVRKVVLAVGYKGKMIQSRYEKGKQYGFEIDFTMESTPMGTGGALLSALSLTASEQVLVLNGDSYVGFDLSVMMAQHKRSGAAVTMVVAEVDDVSRYGAVDVEGRYNSVLRFIEKGDARGPGLINAGCYLFDRQILAKFTKKPCSLETDILPHLQGKMCAVRGERGFIDIGIPEDYARASGFFRQN